MKLAHANGHQDGHTNGHVTSRVALLGPDTLPPMNLEAERSVLGSCLLDGTMIDEVVAVGLKADDFLRAVHGEVWDAMLELQRRGDRVDAVTLADYLIARDRFEKIGGDDLLRGLVDSVPHAANARYYAGIVREKAVGRRIIEACTALIRECQGQQMTASEMLCEAQERMFALSDRDGGNEPVPYSALIDETMVRMSVREETGILGLSSGFPDIDEITKGFRTGDLTIVAGRPGSGKTSLALAFAKAIGAIGVHVLVFSIEMGREALGDRIITADARVDNYKFDRAWSLRPDERDRLTRSAMGLMRIPIAVDFSPARSIAQIAAVSRRHQRRHGLGMVMVDYAQIVKGIRHRNGNRQEEVAGISSGLKELARSLSIPVVALAQLNRKVEERPDKTPIMSDLKECVAGDTRLVDANTGRLVEIRSIRPGMRILGMRPDQKVGAGTATDVWCTGIRPVFRLTTRSNRSIMATANHPLFTADGWRPLESLAIGREIAVAYSSPTPGVGGRHDLCRLLGYLVGNGAAQAHRTLGLILPDNDVFADARSIIGRHWPDVNVKLRSNGYNDAWISRTYENGHGKPGGNPMIEWLKSIGFHGTRDHEKRVPDFVFESGVEGAREFLAGYLATDGCVTGAAEDRSSVRWDTTSLGLARDVAALCGRIGVFVRISPPGFNTKSTKPIYRISLSEEAENITVMAAMVKPIGVKGRRLAESSLVVGARETRSGAFALPASVSALASQRTPWRHQGKRISRRRLGQLGRDYRDGTLSSWAESDVVWDPVATIEPCGEEPVFDICVHGIHCFLTDTGIVAHNSGQLEQDADIVMLTFRPESYDANDRPGIAEIIIDKNRNGRTGTVRLAYLKHCTRFESLSKVAEPGGGLCDDTSF